MKVLIIAFNNLSKCPYVNPYVDFCKKNDIDYELLFPNRSGEKKSSEGTLLEIGWNNKSQKLLNFQKFRTDAIRHLKKNRYDFIIILTTVPAVLLSGYLGRRYQGRYLVDIRDYTYEKVGFYYALEKKVIENAAISVISSSAFRKFLPESEYVMCHNVNAQYRDGKYRRFVPTGDSRITIGYVGSITYKTQCMKLIHLVEKDQRFQFHLYGNETGESTITDYIIAHPNDRIRVFGPYKPADKEYIMTRLDILFNAYGNGCELLNYALSNKLYDALYMGLPLLTSSDTLMSEEAGAYSYDLDMDSVAAMDSLYEWYHQINADAFADYSKAYLQKVFAEQDAFEQHLYEKIIR